MSNVQFSISNFQVFVRSVFHCWTLVIEHSILKILLFRKTWVAYTLSLAVVVCAALSLGCTVHRSGNLRPAVPVPEQFVEGSIQSASSLNRWWEWFGDPWLNALMQEAFSNNLDLARAYARLEQSEALVGVVAASQWPTLNAGGQSSRQSQQSFLGKTTGTNYSLSVSAGYEIDLWKKFSSRTKAARFDAEVSAEDVQAAYLGLSARLADFYYLAAEQRLQLKLTDLTIASFEDTLSRVERRYEAGLVRPVDVYQARQNLAAVRAARPVFEANLALAEHALAVLLGKYPDRKSAGSLTDLPSPPSFPTGIPSNVLQLRPDIRAAFLRIQAADARVASAIAERFPSINLLGAYGTSSSVLGPLTISGPFWNLIGELTQPVFDAGRRKSEVERTKAALRENVVSYKQTVLTAFQEVEDTLAGNTATEERISRLEEEAEASASSLRLSLEHYMQGLSDYLPVLTAQQLDFEAQRRLIEARRQLISNRISLARAIGGTWMQEEMTKRMAATENRN